MGKKSSLSKAVKGKIGVSPKQAQRNLRNTLGSGRLGFKRK